MVKTMPSIIHVVDDEPAVLRGLARGLEAAGFSVTGSSSAREFLARYDAAESGCVVIDLLMPGMSGLDVQAELARRGITPAFVFISGAADISSATRAMKSGAIDFLEKPVDLDVLVEAVNAAIEKDATIRHGQAQTNDARALLSVLTAREREVLARVLAGSSNIAIADELGIAVKTVKVHREHLRSKLGMRSTAELMRLALAAKFWPLPELPRDSRSKLPKG